MQSQGGGLGAPWEHIRNSDTHLRSQNLRFNKVPWGLIRPRSLRRGTPQRALRRERWWKWGYSALRSLPGAALITPGCAIRDVRSLLGRSLSSSPGVGMWPSALPPPTAHRAMPGEWQGRLSAQQHPSRMGWDLGGCTCPFSPEGGLQLDLHFQAIFNQPLIWPGTREAGVRLLVSERERQPQMHCLWYEPWACFLICRGKLHPYFRAKY